MEDLRGAFFLKDWVALFDRVDFSDVITEVSIRVFPVGWRGFHDMQRFGETIFEADRNHYASGKQRREEIAHFDDIEVAVGFGPKARRIMAFRKADGASRLPKEII